MSRKMQNNHHVEILNEQLSNNQIVNLISVYRNSVLLVAHDCKEILVKLSSCLFKEEILVIFIQTGYFSNFLNILFAPIIEPITLCKQFYHVRVYLYQIQYLI